MSCSFRGPGKEKLSGRAVILCTVTLALPDMLTLDRGNPFRTAQVGHTGVPTSKSMSGE